MRIGIGWITVCLLSTGCVIIDVGVTNPIPEMTTIAVAPFFNLSEERAVDGRRFATAYYSELQKVPGYQVIPVGVAEVAIHEYRLSMDRPDDVARLCEILNADAVVVGAITDYSPYYPPRVGMQVEWFSTKDWTFQPGVPLVEVSDGGKFELKRMFRKQRRCCACQQGRHCGRHGKPGRSPEDKLHIGPIASTESPGDGEIAVSEVATKEAEIPDELQPVQLASAQTEMTPLPAPPRLLSVEQEFENPVHLPVMAHTRMFDGADANLTARLRDYVELSGDLRSGGWEAYLQRSEDFIRFTSHVMIVEMLTLHGGETSDRIVLKPRKYK